MLTNDDFECDSIILSRIQHENETNHNLFSNSKHQIEFTQFEPFSQELIDIIRSCNLSLKALAIQSLQFTQGNEDEIKISIKVIHDLLKFRQNDQQQRINLQEDLKKLKGEQNVLEKQIKRLKDDIEYKEKVQGQLENTIKQLRDLTKNEKDKQGNEKDEICKQLAKAQQKNTQILYELKKIQQELAKQKDLNKRSEKNINYMNTFEITSKLSNQNQLNNVINNGWESWQTQKQCLLTENQGLKNYLQTLANQVAQFNLEKEANMQLPFGHLNSQVEILQNQILKIQQRISGKENDRCQQSSTLKQKTSDIKDETYKKTMKKVEITKFEMENTKLNKSIDKSTNRRDLESSLISRISLKEVQGLQDSPQFKNEHEYNKQIEIQLNQQRELKKWDILFK